MKASGSHSCEKRMNTNGHTHWSHTDQASTFPSLWMDPYQIQIQSRTPGFTSAIPTSSGIKAWAIQQLPILPNTYIILPVNSSIILSHQSEGSLRCLWGFYAPLQKTVGNTLPPLHGHIWALSPHLADQNKNNSILKSLQQTSPSLECNNTTNEARLKQILLHQPLQKICSPWGLLCPCPRYTPP